MSTWQPIETAPKDGTRIDLWTKTWIAASDSFMWKRITDCRWSKGDALTNTPARWSGCDPNRVPTHWMPIPAAPEIGEQP